MTTTQEKCQQLYDGLIQAPEYLALPHEDRTACKRFMSLAAQLGSENPPDPNELEAAYGPALGEARQLVARGVLTAALPDGEDGGVAAPDVEKGPANTPATEYSIHPAASIFPMMSDSEIDKLAEDIRENGLLHPIVVHDGQVVDGRNRLEGCKRAGVEPVFVEWKGEGSIVSWILSANLHRRHLTDGQRAIVAGRVAEALAAEGRERSAQNLRKTGGLVDGLDLTRPGEGRSSEQAASLLNVSASATKQATKVLKTGDEKLIEAVTEGKVSLDAAAQVAGLPKKQQRKLVEKGKVKKAAKKIRAKKAASKTPTKKAKTASGKPNGADDAQTPTDTAKEATVGAQPEPPATGQEPAGGSTAASSTVASPDDFPLFRRAHDGLDAMVAAGLRVGNRARVEVGLRSVCAYLTKVIGEFEGGVTP
jgi:ParB-like chromosome segregation protein Spo0J